MTILRAIALVLTLTLLSAGPVRAAEKEKPKEETSAEDTLKLLDLFGDVFEKVREEYVDRPEDKKLVESAINGMLTDLDPHSSYLNKESFAEMQVQTKGEFGGLGIEVTMKNNMVYIVSPIDDTPAFRAGLQAGDFITHIDGESVLGLTIADAVKKMRGKPRTDITLTILREGKEEPFDVTLTRDIITINPVRARAEGDVAYIRVTNFSEQTGEKLKEAIAKEKKEIGDGMRGVVLDLRNNPGGLLNQAIAVADAFLDRGEIVSTRGREPEDTKRYNAAKGDLIEGLPLAVLINTGSASASEIVAGALKDHRRAIVLGTKSFGKGSVQTIVPLSDDNAIRLTTALYYTPSGISIQATGIEPDVVVEQAKVELPESSRKTTEADLRGHLKNGNADEKDAKKKPGKEEEQGEPGNSDAGSDAAPVKEKDAADKDGKAKDAKAADKDDESKPLYERDYQLAYAVDFIRGVTAYSWQPKEGFPLPVKKKEEASENNKDGSGVEKE